jgi:hypothetical protein
MIQTKTIRPVGFQPVRNFGNRMMPVWQRFGQISSNFNGYKHGIEIAFIRNGTHSGPVGTFRCPVPGT